MRDPTCLRLFLNGLLRHTALSREEQEAILDLPGELRRLPPSRDIVRLGDRTCHACMIVGGLAARFDQTMAGLRQITALYMPGDMPDLHSVVLPRSRSALQTLSDTTMLRVPHASIRSVATHYPTIAEALWRECALDTAIAMQWLVNVGRRDAKTRMAHLLCEIVVRLDAGISNNRTTFELRLTQSQLADVVSLTPVHVNRTLRALREDGLVTDHHRRITIEDWAGLVIQGEFDPGYLHAEPSLERQPDMEEMAR